MQLKLAVLAAVACLWLVAEGASAQDLPSTVTTPYVEYQRAVEAGDGAAALDAARRAFEAGEAERIDRETLGLLAENYGSMAAANGQYELAFDIWRQAASLGVRADIAPADQAWRGFNTARAAFFLGRHREAERYARRAGERLGEVEPGDAARLGFPGELYTLSALIAVSASEWDEAGRQARAALAAFAAQNRQPDADYAMAHFLSGAAGTLRRDEARNAYHLEMAARMFSDAPRQDALRRTAEAITQTARYGVEDVDSDVTALLESDPVYRTHYAHRSDQASSSGDDDTQDVQPEHREEPLYPLALAEAGIEGLIVVQFDVGETGRVENAEVLSGFPAGVFDEAAFEALSKWRYLPARQGDSAVRRESVVASFTFVLAAPTYIRH